MCWELFGGSAVSGPAEALWVLSLMFFLNTNSGSPVASSELSVGLRVRLSSTGGTGVNWVNWALPLCVGQDRALGALWG